MAIIPTPTAQWIVAQQRNTLANLAQIQANTSLTIAGAVSLQGGAGGTTSSVGGPVTMAGVFPSMMPDSLPSFAKPDPAQPDTLGWRAWLWSEEHQLLESPHQHTIWPEAELVVPNWDEGEAVRGSAGIHARLVPKNWRIIGWPDGDGSGALHESPLLVTGIIERFGHYVLGTTGWRAEWVVIKELVAPSTDIGLAIERAYPDVIVHYPDQGEATCELVKSSALGKGSRSTSRPRPASFAPPSQPVSPHSPFAHVSQSLQIQMATMHVQIMQNQASAQAQLDLLTGMGISNMRAPPPSSASQENSSLPSAPMDEAEVKFTAVVFWAVVVLTICVVGGAFR